MTDEALAAPVEAAPAEAPLEPAQEAAPSVTTAEAIDKAFATVEAQEAQETEKEAAPAKQEQATKPEAKAEPTEAVAGDRERNPDGTFKAKEAAPEGQEPVTTEVKPEETPKAPTDAPERFTAAAKEAWKDAPEPVKAEVRRLEQELSAGMEKYKSDAEAFDEFRDFAGQLKANGQSLKEVVGHYSGMESLLARDPIAGFELIARNIGTDFQTLASHYLNRAPDEVSHQQNTQITSLHNEIADLKKQLGGVTNTISEQQNKTALQQINEFSADKPRFDELSQDIALFMQTGRAPNLQEAYTLAERLNPAPVSATAPAVVPATPAAQTRDPQADAAQTRKGQLSVTGAPGDGSNPSSRKPPKTARAAVDNAFSQMGIG